MDPKELTEFLSQKPFEEETGVKESPAQSGRPQPVVLVDIKVPFSRLAIFMLKLALACLPFFVVCALAGYLVFKWLPKLLS